MSKDDAGERMRKAEATCRQIGKVIGDTLKTRAPGMGFALFIFDFNGPTFTWISNAQRADMVKALQEFLDRNPPDQLSADRN